jgi:DnaJ-class molecular chaperone
LYENITLKDALAPQALKIKTLDGRTLAVTPNEVITPQSKFVIENEGMPRAQTGEIVIDTQTHIKSL